MNGRIWTKQEDDHLREHWGRLKTAEIGKRKPKDADLDLTGHAPYNDYYMFER